MSSVRLKVITILCLSCTALSGLVTVIMSAAWLTLGTVLCLCCIAPGTGSGGVLWKDHGGTVTIQCRISSDQDSVSLKKGLKEEYDVWFKEENSAKYTIAKEYTGRLQSHGNFPNVSILIKNLTSGDTGPYWCIYTKFDPRSGQMIQNKKDTGSVLLVVKDSTDSMKQCDPAGNELVLVSVVISAAVLLGIIMGFFIWIIKAKSLHSTAKSRRVPGNDVYEDMRGGTLRR